MGIVFTSLTKNGHVRDPRIRRAVEQGSHANTLRTLAVERIYRLRRFKVHLVLFAVGIPTLGGLWVLTEYFEEHTWPSRFASAPDVAGTWDPWFFWVAGIWFLILAINALRAYFGPPIGPIGRYIRRPVSKADVVREVENLKSHRWLFWGSAPD